MPTKRQRNTDKKKTPSSLPSITRNTCSVCVCSSVWLGRGSVSVRTEASKGGMLTASLDSWTVRGCEGMGARLGSTFCAAFGTCIGRALHSRESATLGALQIFPGLPSHPRIPPSMDRHSLCCRQCALRWKSSLSARGPSEQGPNSLRTLWYRIELKIFIDVDTTQ